jgi:hypothetical protein
MHFLLISVRVCADVDLDMKTPPYPMITQTHTLPAKPAVSLDASAPFDVLWGKPIFRAPDMLPRITVPASVPFTAHRITETRRSAK